jgi:DNA-binding CsgD family transcriptional regulator
MSKSGRVRLSDLRRAYRLVDACRDVGHDPRAWPAVMAEGLTRLVDTEVASLGDVLPGASATGPVVIIRADCGWLTQGHRAHYFQQYVRDRRFQQALTFQRFGAAQGALTVRTREQLADDREWYASLEFNEVHRVMEMDDILLSFVRRDDAPRLEGFGLLRGLGRGRFTARERRLVRLFHGEIRRHLGPVLVHDRGEPLARLNKRLTETLDCLLEGDSEKQVAVRLGLSRHTVHQYVKALYRRLGVNTRAELLALYLRHRPGGPKDRA